MGYSIATPLKSPKAKAQMMEFMREHYRPWTSIPGVKDVDRTANPDYDESSYLLEGHELDYDHGASKLGFNYGCLNEPVRQYVQCVLNWMALKAGRTRRFKEIDQGNTSVPYTVYDGHQAYPVLLEDVWGNLVGFHQLWMLVNSIGYKPIPRWWKKRPKGAPALPKESRAYVAKEDKDFKRQEVVIHEELQRLEKLWMEVSNAKDKA